MSLRDCLATARETVAGGWSEPMPRSADGRWVSAYSEDALHFDVDSALHLAAETHNEYLQARALLEAIVNPATSALDAACWLPDDVTDAAAKAIATQAAAEAGSLAAWLERPGRPLAHVLKLFDFALMNARTREAA